MQCNVFLSTNFPPKIIPANMYILFHHENSSPMDKTWLHFRIWSSDKICSLFAGSPNISKYVIVTSWKRSYQYNVRVLHKVIILELYANFNASKARIIIDIINTVITSYYQAFTIYLASQNTKMLQKYIGLIMFNVGHFAREIHVSYISFLCACYQENKQKSDSW